MKRIGKITIKITLLFVLILSIFFLSAVILERTYKEELKNYVVEEVNKELNIIVQVKSLDISVIRKFPFVSVVLEDASAGPSDGFRKDHFMEINADTFFSASKIFLQFNILDIIHKNYHIRKTHILNGKINLLCDASGQVNYNLFKKRDHEAKNPVSLNLDGVKISNFEWTYINLSKKIIAAGYIKDINARGRLSVSGPTLIVSGSNIIEKFSKEGAQYADHLNMKMKVNLAVTDSLYKINKAELNLNEMDFNLEGSFSTGTEPRLDLKMGASSVDVRSFLTILPFETGSVKKFHPRGELDFLVVISGAMSRTKTPDINAAFKLSKAQINIAQKNLSLNGIYLKGVYNNGKMHTPFSSSIKISEYRFTNGKSSLKGTLSIDNLAKPYLNTGISGCVDARHLSDILSYPGLSLQSGFFYPELSIHTSLSDSKHININKIISMIINGNIVVDSISGYVPGLDEHIDHMDGKIEIKDDTWYPELTVKSNESDIKINIRADKVLGCSLFKKAPLNLSGNLYSHFLDLKRFVINKSQNDTSVFLLPRRLIFNFDYSADDLEFGKFQAENINTRISYENGSLSLSSLYMKTQKGRLNMDSGITQISNGNLNIKIVSKLDNIDINQLFNTFNNFAQKFIIEKNLKGLISGDVEMSLSFDNDFKPYFSTLLINSDVIISNGELIDFEPIMKLSRYISLEELAHIKFSSLHNTIIVKDSKVFIPKMDINSSAFNITTSGVHSFDNYFEYKVKVNLSEILASKAKKAKKENEEFGVIEKDDSGTTSIYLSVNGTPEDYKVRYDRKEAITNIREDLQNEKKTLKALLKEEFSSSGKDSTNLRKSGKESSDQFIMDWDDEEDNGKNKKPLRRSDDEKKPEFEIEW